MTQPRYQWPNPINIYPDQGKKSYRMKRLRFHLRSWLHFRNIKHFSRLVNQNPTLVRFLNNRPNYSYPLVHRFLDKRFNARQRFQAIFDNLTFLPQQLGQNSPHYQPVSFGEVIEDFELRLNVNEHQPMEGFWALELRHRPDDRLVYLLTFGKIEEQLLIAVIQGPHFDGSKELVKLLTKKCHGLRPAYLMVEAMKLLAQVLGYSALLGIPHKYQNKSRLVQSQRYTVDYDKIFSESGGSPGRYWTLSVQREERDYSQIASNKRSMYRKRDAMLDNLLHAMQQALEPSSPSK